MIFGIVEGEPGIFPDPIARLLRALANPLRRRARGATEPEQDDDGPPPADDRST